MKRILFMLAGLLFMFASCSDEGKDEFSNAKPNPQPEEQASITMTTDIPTGGLVFDVKGGEQSVSFFTNQNWTLSIATTTGGETWCTSSATNGNKGNITVKFTVKENTNKDDRSVIVTIKTGTAKYIFRITQKGVDVLTMTSSIFEVSQERDTVDIEVKSDINYQLEIAETVKDWIWEANSMNTKRHSFAIAANEKKEKREGEIYIKSGDKLETIKIYQAGNALILLSQNEYNVDDDGETISINIKSHVEFEVQMPDVDWIIDDNSSHGISSHTLKYVIEPNENHDIRSAKIVFKDKNSDIRETLMIIQAKKDAVIISNNECDVNSTGETIEVKLSANVDYEVTLPDADWIIPIEPHTIKNNTLYFKIAKNESIKDRKANILIADKNSLLSDTLTIHQKGNDIPFELSQTKYSIPLQGGHIAVCIRYNKPYKVMDWTGITFYQDDVLKTDSMDVLVFYISPNDTDREQTIIIADEDETYNQTIHIKQRATGEELHWDNGDADGIHGVICHYSGGTVFFDIHTNVEHYDIFIEDIYNQRTVEHLFTEKTYFGFREWFEIPTNTSELNKKYRIAFVSQNITLLLKVEVRPQLFIHIDEGREMYISEKGGAFTIHAWTKDDNLNVKLEGDDTSWLSIQNTEDTYKNGVRQINTTFVAEPNKTGKTRELYVVAYNAFNDSERIKLIQPSDEGILLSNEKIIVGAWGNTQTILLKDCEYTIEPDASASWITIEQAKKKNGIIEQPLSVEPNIGDKERSATLIIKSKSIKHELKIRQMPESGSLADDSPESWKGFDLPPVDVQNPYSNKTGSMLYFSIVENPENFIHIQSRKVLEQLYFTPEDEFIPKLNHLEYVIDNYDGISACYGGGNMKGIVLSYQYIESFYTEYGAKALVQENRGILFHELTHAFQLEPKGCGSYENSKVFHSCIEGMADAVRVLCGGFSNDSDRPKGGHYLDSYRYTGYFIAWLVKNKDKDFLRKFNLSTQYVNPWSFEGAIKYILGDKYDVDELWTEYLKAMGDI